MLNTFPYLLNFTFIIPFILRIFVGSYFLKQTWIEFKKHPRRKSNIPKLNRTIGALAAIFLLLGLFTQLTSLFLIVLTFFNIYYKKKNNTLKEGKLDFYVLLVGILLSLIISGAGILAIDIPL